MLSIPKDIGIDKFNPSDLNIIRKVLPQEKLQAALAWQDGYHTFFTEKRYFNYSTKNSLDRIAYISSAWKGTPDNLDGSFLHFESDTAYFFKGNKYTSINYNRFDQNNAFLISRFWKGVPSNIDAVTKHPNGKIYFFKGNKYYRYDLKLKKVDKTALIKSNWIGVPDNISAAFLHKNGRIYLFKVEYSKGKNAVKYYRYNVGLEKVDKIGLVGSDGWRELDFNKKNFFVR